MCRRPDQRLFNDNLLKVFNSEYNRQHPGDAAAIDKTILDWKFSALDANNDNQLQKIECKELRRLVRKVSVHTVQWGENSNFIYFEFSVAGNQTETMRSAVRQTIVL